MRKTILIAAALVILGLFISLALLIWFRMGPIPSSKELAEIHHHSASEIYSLDGVLLGRYFSENRTNIQFEEIPKHFLDALIATEDARFFEHEGVDYRSLVRVLIKTMVMGDRSAGGGSTLSQQLAKNLYPRKGDGAVALAAAKFKEMIVASRMETIYSKNDLLTLYLNTVSFGEDVYGLETAASRYFSKQPIELNLQESAVLVGILKANTAYNPRLYPGQAKIRRNTVISQMAKYEYLSEEAADSISRMPIDLNYRRLTNERGTAPYFKAKVRPIVDSLLSTLKKPDGNDYNLEQDGLRITLPIDSRLQYFADSAVAQHLSQLQKLFYQHWGSNRPWDEKPAILDFALKHTEAYQKLVDQKEKPEEIKRKMNTRKPMIIYCNDCDADTVMSPMDSIKHYLMLLQTGVLAMEPGTGQIKAWVGGLDFEFFQFDHVTATRQVGSTFKPIVYAAALEKGIKPCDFFKNERVVYQDYDDWSPRNAGETYEGFYSLKGALTKSVNTVSAQVIMEAGIERVIELAHKLGIRQELPQVPSLALGTADLSLLEMVTAYATIANKGVRVDPVYVLKIERSDGRVIWEHQPTEGIEVLPKKTAQLITNFMQNVIDEGTGRSLRSRYNLSIEVAGKTGTTQSYADGWFIGFTPNIVAGVWVGADNPGVHFRTGEYGQGARMALPVWAIWMKQALNEPEFYPWNEVKFDSLDAELRQAIDCLPYTENMTLLDRLFGVKDRGKDKEEAEEKKPFFKRLKKLFKKKEE